MTSRERMETALKGGKPDRAPIMPILGREYELGCMGKDCRDWIAATNPERIEIEEKMFLLHDVDGFLVDRSGETDFLEKHLVEKMRGYWRVTSLETGERFHLLPDGVRTRPDGTAVPAGSSLSGGRSQIQTEADIPRYAPPIRSVEEIEALNWYAPLAYLREKYPDRHFSFQTASPMAFAVEACGGYVEGLTMMLEAPDLFTRLLEHCVRKELARIEAGRRAGADSTLFTCYYTGADTISPRDYARVVFPFERQLCQAAKDAGLFVLNWYLGDLMPNLGTVMDLPLDALVLEQGRRENLARELRRQFEGAGREGAFVVGTPIMPPGARREAVEFYFQEARRLCRY